LIITPPHYESGKMMEHLLAKIAAMQEKVVSHHEKMNASQECPIAKIVAWRAEMRAW
jgi:hypothetical protein